MKKILLLLALLSGIAVSTAYSQIGQTIPREEPSGFAQQLWYGGGFNLGFSGNGAVSLFQLGVSPMVGYKIFEPFSIGPRVALQYNLYSARTGNGGRDSAGPLSWAVGAFMRYKVVPMFFAHAEIELENQPVVYAGTNELQVSRRERNNVYVGGGYTSSQGFGSFGYELLLLFNLNRAENSVDLPYIFRIGLTYGF